MSCVAVEHFIVQVFCSIFFSWCMDSTTVLLTRNYFIFVNITFGMKTKQFFEQWTNSDNYRNQWADQTIRMHNKRQERGGLGSFLFLFTGFYILSEGLLRKIIFELKKKKKLKKNLLFRLSIHLSLLSVLSDKRAVICLGWSKEAEFEKNFFGVVRNLEKMHFNVRRGCTAKI